MASLVLKQLTILLWKSWIMRKRHYISTIFELIFPLVLTIIVVAIQSNATSGLSSKNSKHGSEYNRESNEDSIWEGPIFYDIGVNYTINNIFKRYSTTIYYAPKNSMTNQIMDYLKISQNTKLTIEGFIDEPTLEANLTTQSADQGYGTDIIGVVFVLDNYQPNNYNFKYKIRLSRYSMHVDKLFPIKTNSRPTSYKGYTQYQDEFMQIQVALNEAYLYFIAQSNQTNTKKINVSKISPHPIPYPRYLDSGVDYGN